MHLSRFCSSHRCKQFRKKLPRVKIVPPTSDPDGIIEDHSSFILVSWRWKVINEFPLIWQPVAGRNASTFGCARFVNELC